MKAEKPSDAVSIESIMDRGAIAMPTTRTRGVATVSEAKGPLPRLRALADRLSRDLDAAEHAADTTRLAHALRAVLVSIADLERHTPEAAPAPPVRPVDELIERRRRRGPEPPGAA